MFSHSPKLLPSQIILKGLSIPEPEPMDSSEDESEYSCVESQLLAYLKQYPLREAKQKNDQRSIQEIRQLIKRLKSEEEGKCVGITSVVIYSLWLSTQPKRKDSEGKPIPRDDWEWLEPVLAELSSWYSKEEEPLSQEDQNNFRRFMELILFFQEPDAFFSLGEGDFDKAFEDTQHRQLQSEYSLVGIFTPLDFTKEILIEEAGKPSLKTTIIDILTPENKLVFAGTEGHQTGMIRIGDTIFYYNPPPGSGSIMKFKVNEKAALIKSLFKENDFFLKSQFSFGLFDFRIFGFGTKAHFPEQALVLNKLNYVQQPLMKQELISHLLHLKRSPVLELATRMGCLASIRFYLSFLKENISPLAYQRHINLQNKDRWTVLHFAAEHGREAIARFFLAEGVDASKKSLQGDLALDVALDEKIKLVFVEAQVLRREPREEKQAALAPAFFNAKHKTLGKHPRDQALSTTLLAAEGLAQRAEKQHRC